MIIVCNLLQIYLLIVLVRIVMSWFPLQRGGVAEQITGVLGGLTEPVLGPLRSVLPSVPMGGMRLDLSPLVLILGISVLQGILGC